jgi:hypothetical protein
VSKIYIDQFGGISPRIDPKLLGDTMAQKAENCRLISGKIVPLNGLTKIVNAATLYDQVNGTIPAGSKRIYLWRHWIDSAHWLTWDHDVDVVRGPIADDDKYRIFYTDSGMPGTAQNPTMYVKAFFLGADPATLPDGYSGRTPADDGYVVTRQAKLAEGQDTLLITPTDRTGFMGTFLVNMSGVATMDISTISSDGKTVADSTKDISTIVTSSFVPSSVTRDKYTGGWIAKGYFPTGLSSTIGNLGKTSIRGVHIDSISVSSGLKDGLGNALSTTSPSLSPTQFVDGNEFVLADAYGQYGTAKVFISFTSPIITIDGWTAQRSMMECTVSVVPTFTQGPTSLEYVSYVQTVVDDWGMEGPPSDPTVDIEWMPGQLMMITGIGSNVPSGGHARLYRTAAGTNEDHFYYVPYSIDGTEIDDEGIPQGTASFPDTLDDASLAEELPLFENPPDDLMGLVALPNGTLAAFHPGDPTTTDQSRELCFSGVNYPHSWPTEYRETTQFDIVGLGVAGNDLAALTKGYHEMATGNDPSMITMTRLVTPYACVSKQSITTINGMICFACAQGIAAIAGGVVHLLTNKYYSGKEWAPLLPAGLRMQSYDTGLVGFFADGGIMVDLDPADSAKIGITTTNLLVGELNYTTVGGMFLDIESDTMYLIAYDADSQATNIYSWNTDSNNPMWATWKSKNFSGNRLVNWTSMRLVCSAYPVGANAPVVNFIPEGGISMQGVTVTSQVSRRIPKMKPERCWAVQVTTKDQCDGLFVGTSMQELV